MVVYTAQATDNHPVDYLGEDFWETPTWTTPDTLPPIQDRQESQLSNQTNPFDLKDPKVIEKEVEYDAENDLYIIKETINGSYYRPPTYLTPKEYFAWRAKQEDKKYYEELAQRNRTTEIEGDPIEPYKERISQSLIERLFCGSTIDVRPQGNVGVTLGFDYQRIANPVLTEQQQQQGGFDFDMNIQLSVVGKIGQKLQLSFNYNTQSTFDFDRQIKVEYLSETDCSEDDIIKKIEAGNVSFPLRSSLIQGRQNLFGFRTDLQFGRLSMSLVASQSQTQRKEIQIQGGSQLQDFEVTADNYDENRHFFLSHYNRQTYEENLVNLPQINTLFKITKLEVWVTNDRNVTEGVRDVVGYADLGETNVSKMVSGTQFQPMTAPEQGVDLRNNRLPDNEANTLYAQLLASENGNPARDARGLQSSIAALRGAPFNMNDSEDFAKIRARKLAPSEYSFDPKLGFISVNVAIKPTDVVAVAYQYSYNGKIYQVGEFAQDLPLDADTLNVMHLKLLKGQRTRVDLPIWDLMMKNIYSLGAYQINQEDFMLDVFYQDPGGGEKRFIPEGPSSGVPLLNLLNLDRLNRMRDPLPDGQFDYVPGVTILPQNGRVIFPVLEPFGSSMQSAFYLQDGDPGSLSPISQKYLYPQLYDSTIFRAREFPEFNRYIIRGRYKSSVSSEISLGGFNIPKGSVVVTAGGRTLVEGQDYSIDYNLGRIKILNEAYLNSGQPIRVAFEDNATFGFNQQGFFGSRFDYFVDENINIGATFLHLNERPFTQKVNYGDDPIANSIYGLDVQYSKEAPWLTRAVDALPLLSTKAMSNISFSAEFAHLIPGSPNVINQGQDKGGVVYIDDFEGATANFNLSIPSLNWVLASTPRSNLSQPLFPEAQLSNNLEYNKNRAKIDWYNLEPRLVAESGNQSIYIRQINQQDVFQNLQLNQSNVGFLRTFDLNYHPAERGPYNFDTTHLNQDGTFNNPQDRWGGIMRALTNTDFEASNIEFVEMWVMSPFKEGRGGSGGDLYIELGDISEDILKDSRLFFENGLPSSSDQSTNTDQTVWSRVPRVQAVTRAFDNDPAVRDEQDVGLDGYNDKGERILYAEYLAAINRLAAAGRLNADVLQAIENDPANDNFRFYRDPFFNDPNNLPGTGANQVLDRYKRYNNPQGNSSNDPDPNQQNLSTSTNIPDTEDLNRDNTLNEQEAYFRYRIPIRPEAGERMAFTQYTVDSVRQEYNGESVYWYQLKIPVDKFTSRVGGIADFRAIRFMRMYMTGFDEEVTLRMARLDLIRNQWRRYTRPLVQPGIVIPPDDPNNTDFDVFAVNIEENGSRAPFNYVLPPGVQREQIIGSIQNAQANEQSQALRICNLEEGDARGIFKILNLDMRVYKRLKMFVHAENFGTGPANNPGDMTLFVRLGSDFESNYYEYEIPLTMSEEANGTSESENIWLSDNELDLPLELLQKIKLDRGGRGLDIGQLYEIADGDNVLRIKGNPTLGQVKGVMIGVRNRKDDGLARCTEVWVNEMRLTGFDQRGGFAGLARLDVQLADLGQITASGSYQSIGFGSIDQSVNERSREELIEYDVSGSLRLDKFFPEDWKLSIPFYAQYSQEISTPEFDPYELDVRLRDRLNSIQDLRIRDSVRTAAQTTRTITSYNFTNVRKGRTSKIVPLPTDISNFSFTYAYSKDLFRSPIIAREERVEQRGVIDYTYAPGLKPLYPFKKAIGKIKNKKAVKWLGLIREINFNPLPTTIGFRNELRRNFGETTYRFTGDATSTYYDKKFVWDRGYNLQWSHFRSMRLNYTASNNALIDEPIGRLDTRQKRDAVWDNIKRFGRTKNYQHNIGVTYTLPLKYIPALDWVTVKGQYNATYSWTAATLGLDSLGNVIQNSQRRQATADLQFQKLYDKWKYLKKINTPLRPGQKAEKKKAKLPERLTYDKPLRSFEDPVEREAEKAKRKMERKARRAAVAKARDQAQPGGVERAFIRPLMLLRRAQIRYSENFTTVLPGFTGFSKYVGQDFTGTSTNSGPRPGWAFIAGLQPDRAWLDEAATSGWITNSIYQNQPLIQTRTQKYSANLTLEPVRGFKIDVDVSKNVMENYQELFKVEDMLSNNQFSHLNGMRTGSVTMTYLPLGSFFDKEGSRGTNSSMNFEQFERNRLIISQRRGVGEHDDQENNPGFTEGYGRYQQDVLIPAFLAAYTNQDANHVYLGDIRNILPMPNWKLTYNGLAKIPGLDKIFSSFRLSHGYKSTLTVSSFTTDLDYANTLANRGTDGKDVNSLNYFSSFEIPNLVISESFNPLVGLDMRFKNELSMNFQYKTSRNLAMSFIDYQLSEQNTTEIEVGFGWNFKNFKLIEFFKKKKKKDDNRTKTKTGNFDVNFDFGKTIAKDELNLTCDVSFRDDKTINHILDQNQSVATRGMRTIRISPAVEWIPNNRLTFRLFFDYTQTTPAVSTSFPITSLKGGLNIRFSLSQ